MTAIKKHRAIRIADNPEKVILPEVRELARALNHLGISVPEFSKKYALSQSGIYSWFNGKSQPKQNSLATIRKFFAEIGFEMQPAVTAEDAPDYYAGRLMHSDEELNSQSLVTMLKDIQLALRIQTEQYEFIKRHTSRLDEKLSYLAADVKAIHEYLALHHSEGSDNSREALMQLFRRLSANYYSGS